MRNNITISFSILLFLFSVLSEAQERQISTDELFSAGIEQYQKGQFFEAIESFEQILQQDFESFETYYNLGNAYFKTNQLPYAIYYYEKALQLKPRNEDAIHNLEYANSLILRDGQNVPEAFHIRLSHKTMKLLTPNAWAISGIVLFILTLLCVVFFLMQVNQRLKRIFFYLSLTGLMMTSATWFFGHRLYKSITEPNHAIIIVASTGIKSSPEKTSADVYVAQSGTKVKIISKLGDWYEVRVPDGNKGWIKVESVRLI